MSLIRRLPLTLLGLAAACASPVAVENPIRASLVELHQFQLDQQVFREQNVAPIQFDFPGQGRVVVREISLDGYPGNTYVRCSFTYQNRTDKPVVQSWIMLDVLDPKGRTVATQATVAIMPIIMPIGRGAYFADELRTQTYGVHAEPGWSWRIRCVAQQEKDEEPLDPPAPEPGTRQPPPMTIKPR